MIDWIVNEVTNKLFDNLFPIFGGGIGGFIAWMRFEQYLEALITISIGAILGWLIKEALNWCKRKLNKHDPDART